MPVIKEIIAPNGGEEPVTIHIEVEEASTPDYYPDLRGPGSQAVEAAKDVFKSGMQLIRTCAEQVVHTIHSIDQEIRPAEIEVQLAIKLDSEVGAILTKTSAEAQLQVTMKWVKKEQP